jgi:hypothetical protein
VTSGKFMESLGVYWLATLEKFVYRVSESMYRQPVTNSSENNGNSFAVLSDHLLELLIIF